jgi:hypothetical protein
MPCFRCIYNSMIVFYASLQIESTYDSSCVKFCLDCELCYYQHNYIKPKKTLE